MLNMGWCRKPVILAAAWWIMAIVAVCPAQADQVKLLGPSPETFIPVSPITLEWNSFPGARSYAYYLTDKYSGATLPGGESNPHFVGDVTQVVLDMNTRETTWEWSVVAYSDAQGTQEISGSRSETWRFFTTNTPPTATPTPTPVSIDFNEDGVEDGRDLFLFGAIWGLSRTAPNVPYLAKANLDTEGPFIDGSDLIAVRNEFMERNFPEAYQTPVPGLPAPELLRPSDGTTLQVASYNRAPGLFLWSEVVDAATYELELDGPQLFPQRSFFVNDTTLTWEDEPPEPPAYRVTNEGSMFWRVRAIDADGEPGQWSEQRELVLTFSNAPTADINFDDWVDLLDIFEVVTTWYREDVEQDFIARLDYDSSGDITQEDLLTFMRLYNAAQKAQSGGEWVPTAPVVTQPPNQTTFTLTEVQAGQAEFTWESVDGAAWYRVTLYSTSSEQQVERDVFSQSYTLTFPDDQVVFNNQPARFTVKAIGPGGEIGVESVPLTFTVNTTSK